MDAPPTIADPINVLVVDDEPDLEILIRQMFRRQIRSGQLSFSFARDGVDALEKLEEDGITDIVLSDINMPRMDGLSLLTRIRELERHVKVIIVSAYGDMENIRTAMNRGAFDFITKPISFDDLTVTIEKTHQDLEIHRQARLAREQLAALHRELDIAAKIQLSMLPPAFPAFPDQEGFELYATMTPAQEVGGDLYDCFLLEDGRLGFVLGDVAGKGLGAALLMAITRTMLRATAQRGGSPAECLRAVNLALFPETMPHMFVTVVYGTLDPETGHAEICNAGHNYPHLVRADGSVERIETPRSLALCLVRDFTYQDTSVQMNPGETLVLHSDGIPEARNRSDEEFEEPRLIKVLETTHEAPTATVAETIISAVEAFSDGLPRGDDMTLLLLRYTGRTNLYA
jgi:phosphoserine phosphatase RsbU/P